MNQEVRSRVRELTNSELLESARDPFSDIEPPRKRAKPSFADVDLIGLERGASSFKVPPLYERRKGRLPREDGKEWPEDMEEGDEGGYFEAEWRTEEEFRREALEKNPDYQFLRLVAGASNTVVEQLYEEGDISAAFRRERALIIQQRTAIEQVRTSIKELEEDIKLLDSDILFLSQRNKVLLADRLTLDSLINRLSLSVVNYESEKEDNLHLTRQESILERYTEVSVLSSDAFKDLTKEILAEAEYLLAQSDREGIEIKKEEKRLVNLLRQKRDEVIEDPMKLKDLIKQVLVFWFYISDPEKYQEWFSSDSVERERLLNVYIEEILGSNLIGISNAAMAAEKTSVLRIFTESLPYFFSRSILLIVPEDIGTVEKEGDVIKAIDPFPFDEDRAQRLFLKYGGLLFRERRDPKVDITHFYTSVFKVEVDKVSRRLKDEKFRKEFHGFYFGPFVVQLKIHREGLKSEINEIEERLEELETSRDNERDRLSGLRAGTISFRDVEQPYRHRREWVEDPKQSGIVKIKPIVVNGIDAAFGLIQTYTEYGSFIDIESLQYGKLIQGDFARLVAAQIGKSSLIFPKQYLQKGVEAMNKRLEFNAMQKLKNNYEFRKNFETDSPKYVAMIKGD